MKLALRRVFLTAGAVLGLVFFSLFSASLYYLFFSGNTKNLPSSIRVVLWPLLGIGAASLFSVVGGFGFRRLFRRTASLEIFFFLTFIISLSFDALKILSLVFISVNYPSYYGTLITRLAYFGYFLGLLSVFASSLFSGEVRYQKMGTILGIILGLSFSLAYALPVDETLLHPNLLYRVGGEDYILLVRFGLESLALFGFARSAYLAASREQWIICGSIALVIIGRELLFFLSSPLYILLGFAGLAAGSFFFSRKSYLKHLWI